MQAAKARSIWEIDLLAALLPNEVGRSLIVWYYVRSAAGLPPSRAIG